MTASPALSIIVPAYNAEKYLVDCLESILNNTFQDFEILLVNDGSTDRTGALCDEMAEKYHRITVFHTENHGLADARNVGLEHATGEFISFIDSDDVVASDMFENMIRAMKPDVQLVICQFRRCEENEADPTPKGPAVPVYGSQTMCAQMILDGRYSDYVCNKLYRRELLEKEHIRFRKNCRAMEDIYFNWLHIRYVQKAAFLDKPYYQYIMHPGSIMNSFRTKRIVSDNYMDLPRSWKYCAETVADIAPELLAESVARTAMFYQTVLRKLKDPSPEYIAEACSYVRRNRSALRHCKWGFKYYCSALILAMGYPVWKLIFRRGLS